MYKINRDTISEIQSNSAPTTGIDVEVKPKIPKQLARKSTLSFINNILIMIFGFISLFFVKRYMGYEAVGMIAFATSFMAMFSIFGDMGFSVAHLKRVGEGYDVGRCNGTIISIKLLLTFIMGIAISSYLLIQKYIFNYEFESREMELILYVIVIQYLILNVSMAFRNIYTAKLEIARGQIPRLISRFLIMLMKVSIAIIGLSAIYLAYSELIGAVIIFALLILFFKGHALKRPNIEFIRLYASFAFPVLFIGFVATFAQSIDKVMLGYFVSSVEVGIYAVPQRITHSLLIISGVITNILFVAFSGHYANKRFDVIQRLSNDAEKYISMLILPFVIFVLIFAESILLIFGDDTTPSIPILQILVVAIYINATMKPYSVQIISTGHIRLGFKLASLTLLMNLSLNFIFIPQEVAGIILLGLGAKGAAIATLISLTVRGLIAKIFAYKITETRPNIRILLHFIAAVLTFIPIYLIHSHYPLHWSYTFVYLPIIICIFLGIMAIFREFTRKELEFYMNAIHPGRMKKYVVGELRGK